MTLNIKSPYKVENEKLSKLMRDAGGDKVFEALPMSRIAWLLTIHKRPDLNYNLLEFGRGQVSLTRLIHVCLRLIRRVYFQVTSATTFISFTKKCVHGPNLITKKCVLKLKIITKRCDNIRRANKYA